MSRLLSLKVDWEQYDFGPRDVEKVEDWMLKAKKLDRSFKTTVPVAKKLGVDPEPAYRTLRWHPSIERRRKMSRSAVLTVEEREKLDDWCSTLKRRIEDEIDLEEVRDVYDDLDRSLEETYGEFVSECYTAYKWATGVEHLCELSREHDRPLSIS